MDWGVIASTNRPGSNRFNRNSRIEPCGYSTTLNARFERNAEECFGHIARANARYHGGDPECEADFRAAFLLDARLTATEIVRELANEVRDDVGNVVLNCMERLAIDSRDVVARARLGLTLLLLYQDTEAFENLQQAFLQNPSWRPLLRLLVNKVKLRRAKILPLILRRHQDACP